MIDYSQYKTWLAKSAIKALVRIMRDEKCSDELRLKAARKLLEWAK